MRTGRALGALAVTLALAGCGAAAAGTAGDAGTMGSGPAPSGRTWTRAGTVSGGVDALAAAAPEGEAGVVRVWVATSAGLLTSTDGGATFA